ncbi:50S ribosomal protein L29 [Prochlorococcus marinus]|uniref:Large ribosomal subunit protein uL29 n=1 Tax=Prochlorococcus marinus (strain MIT 9211) TaxID=93059 RepID=RL29_PROM4|nr:50S ribosomal protein L29 [Prochlorococcus marinus]A9BCN9.1 RecName: Full=Large ribosomal subunit protein uL29; AltName: Full=50S ribosomal protein L29 [Prochlorococcus marinus str. MIT 9211]ABX09601.1 50S ribosomal protein L29 [Prochlorococcus marinus str. MIT 9211]
MARPEISEVTKLTDDDLKNKIDEIRKELFDLRFKRATRQLSETHRFKEARIQLAQLLTVQGDRNRSKTSS